MDDINNNKTILQEDFGVFLTYKQLADKLGVKHETVWRYYSLGKNMPQRTTLPNNKTVIMLKDFKEWMANAKYK